jgi:hypothetical protein
MASAEHDTNTKWRDDLVPSKIMIENYMDNSSYPDGPLWFIFCLVSLLNDLAS